MGKVGLSPYRVLRCRSWAPTTDEETGWDGVGKSVEGCRESGSISSMAEILWAKFVRWLVEIGVTGSREG